jgi:hypothetical protein
MTVLEELIELALLACERGRQAVQHHIQNAGNASIVAAAVQANNCRGAAVLGPDGKV